MKPFVAFSSSVPLCFDSRRQFEEWKATARMAPPPEGMSVCGDCTAKYQKLMLKEGRCENPHVRFDSTGEPILPHHTHHLKPS